MQKKKKEKKEENLKNVGSPGSKYTSSRMYSKSHLLMKIIFHVVFLFQAKNLIERFFSQQVEVLGRRASPLPEIYYIEDTLQMVWINRCFPGFGISAVKHPKCPECCGRSWAVLPASRSCAFASVHYA